MDTTLFQFCQKLVVFNKSLDAVLLAKRRGENDFNEIYSFIGGKMETGDSDILTGIRREKNEEIGAKAQLLVYTKISYNEFYKKKSGQMMILPHYYAVYLGGDIILNDEYSDYIWVKLLDLDNFQPKIPTIPNAVKSVLEISKLADNFEFEKI